MSELVLESADFKNGEEIPQKHGYKHGNTRPQLTIKNIPSGCKSLALIMDDPDAMQAVGKVWVHWTIWNIPANVETIDASSIPTRLH